MTEPFVVLDAVSAVLTLIVAAFFLQLVWATRESLHLLFAVGFLLLGLSFTSVAASELNLTVAPLEIDAFQLSGQLAGALVLLMGYLSVRRHGRARLWIALAWAAAAAGLFFAVLYLVVPPFLTLPDLATSIPYAEGLMFLSFAGCAAMAASGFARHPTLDRVLVPAAFACLAATKYTWLLFDLSGSLSIVPFVYVWRFLALGLFLFAIRLPPRRPPGDARA